MTDTPAPLSGDSLRDIFPDTVSMYKAFIDRIPTPIQAPNESYYLEYSRTLTAAKKASEYALKNWKQKQDGIIAAALQSERQRIAEKIYRDIQINGHITADEFKEQYLGERNMSKLKIKQTYSKRCLYCEHLNDFLLRDTNVNTNITDDDIYRLAGNNMGEIESTWCDNCNRLTAQMTVSYNVEGANR